MQRLSKIAAAAALAVVVGGLGACTSEPGPTGQQKEDKTRVAAQNKLVDSQPAHTMDYSPTRATKNFWIDTWDEKGKLSYVYLMNGSGEVFGYFVLEGLPVSYCTGLIPPYTFIEKPGDGIAGKSPEQVPAPSIDGTYSSGSNCNVYYGKDATSGAYIEYTTGMGINALVFSEAMPQYGAAQPLGDAKVR